MAIHCLDRDEHSTVVAQRIAGHSLSTIAKDLKVSPDTISRLLREAGGMLNIFTKDGDVYTMPDRTILVKGSLMTQRIVTTGKIEDGIIVCDDVFLMTDSIPDPKFLVFDYTVEENDLVASGELKVGFVIQNENEWVAGRADPMLYDPALHAVTTLDEIAPGYGVYNAVVSFISNVESAEQFVNEGLDDPEPADPGPEPVWSATSKFISITVGRESHSAGNDHPMFNKALVELAAGNVRKALDMISIKHAITKYTSESGHIKIENGKIYYCDIEIRSSLVTRILSHMEKGEDFKFFIPFLEKLMANPSRTVVKRIFDFLEANDIEILADGNFVAWKKVRHNYKDIHSGTFDNSPGQTVMMLRNQVDEDDEVTCSSGLHVCSKSYLPSFGRGAGNRVVSVHVNPADVVSVPVDYNSAKMRTCKYVVYEDVTHKF